MVGNDSCDDDDDDDGDDDEYDDGGGDDDDDDVRGDNITVTERRDYSMEG